jgi:hypothetical protein
MEGITCDRCGKGLLIDEEVRYEVKIVVQAASDPMELTTQDLAKDHRSEIERLLKQLEQLSPDEAQDQVYREMSFDLCPPCQRAYLRQPLPK